MNPMWVPGSHDPVIIDGHHIRPAQRRGRLASELVNRHPQTYYTDGNGLLVPAGASGVSRMRAASASDQRRPTQIVINNEFDPHSPQRSPHRHQRHGSHGHDYHHDDYSDDSWDDRAHSPHRHRGHSRHRRSPSRSPSPRYDFEYEKMKAKVEELERREHAAEEEVRRRERYEEERLLEEALAVKRKKDEEAFKKAAIEEYNIRQLEEKVKEEEKKKKAEEEYKKRVRKDLEKSGYDDDDIQKILKGKAKDHGHEHDHGHGHGHGHGIMDLSRPTHLRVHRKHLSPETLDIYELPWGWDEVSWHNLYPIYM